MPRLDAEVEKELRAFTVVLSHLPLEVQLDILRDGTKQMSDVLEGITI